jgi:hypothetical protein
MSLEDSTKSISTSKEELDVISNRIAIALAKREKLVKSWTALSTRPKEPEKTQEELDAEDAALFRSQPPYLGVGAPIPSHFLVSDAERNNKSLRAKFFPTKGLKGSKSRDEEEKAASAKRGLIEESSDEEGGRSSVGKAKKRKTTADLPSKGTESEDKPITRNKVAKEKQSDVRTLSTLAYVFSHSILSHWQDLRQHRQGKMPTIELRSHFPKKQKAQKSLTIKMKHLPVPTKKQRP